ncbi:MAG: hypothetical protein ABIK45_12430 [Pseudomonadota bacterium]
MSDEQLKDIFDYVTNNGESHGWAESVRIGEIQSELGNDNTSQQPGETYDNWQHRIGGMTND